MKRNKYMGVMGIINETNPCGNMIENYNYGG
jgi:hypothetical protein